MLSKCQEFDQESNKLSGNVYHQESRRPYITHQLKTIDTSF